MRKALMFIRLLIPILMLFAAKSAWAATYTSASETFNWIDASTHAQVGYNTSPYKFRNTGGCGTNPPVIDDNLSDNIPIGFNFNYGSINFTQVRIMSNGRLQFNNNTTCGFGSPVTQLPYPNTSLNYTLRIYGNDLDPTAKSDVPFYQTTCLNRSSCYVSYATIGSAPNRRFVVTWFHIPEWAAASTASGSYDLQVILEEGGDFIYQFGNDVPGPGNVDAQVGWQIDINDYEVPQIGFPATNSAIRFSIPKPIAEYRMQQNLWNGTSGEVADNTGNYSGTAASLNTTKPTTANVTPAIPGNPGTCNYGQFNRTNKDYVALPNGFPNLGANGTAFTVTTWIRTTNNTLSGQRIFIDDENNNNGYGISLGDGGTGMLRFFSRGTSSALILDTGNVITNNTWYFVAAIADVPNKTKRIYVYNTAGTQLASVSTNWTENSFGSDNGIVSIGGETNTSGERSSSFGFSGNIDELRVYQSALNVNALNIIRQSTHTCNAAIDHIQIEHPSGNGVTCSPTTLTIKACADAACSTLYTGGVSGTLTATGSGTVNWGDGTADFNIPASGSITKTLQLTSVNTNVSTTLGATSITPAPTAATSCNFAGCLYTAFNSGFIFDIPNHVAGVTQTVAISAVKKADNSNVCVPGLANVTRTLQMACSYINPSTGTLPMLVNGRYLNNTNNANSMCASSNPVSLAFNNTGVANATLSYPDVGSMRLTVAYSGAVATGDVGLSINGTDTFIAAPKDFAFSSITAAPIKAGNSFGATVTARNNDNNLTPNFGNESSPESATISFAKFQPTGSGAVNGIFSGTLGAFTNGVATSSNLNWSEVGLIDLNAILTSNNYLGSGFTAVGSTGNSGAVGRFTPHHFDTIVTQGCTSGNFTYSAQPFNVQVRALNAGGNVTQNYDGSINTTPNFAKTITLSDSNATGLGAIVNPTLSATAFLAGVANATPNYTFTSARTAPTTIKLRAIDTDNISSATGLEGTALIRSGRLYLQNAYGSELLDLPMQLEAQYWNGTAYIRNQLDNCTTIPISSIAMGNYKNSLNACETQIGYTSGTGTLSNGASNFLRLTKPGANNNGSVDLSINLNASAGSTCNSVTPSAASNANMPWFGSNPNSRATFGIYKTPIIYMRENY